MFPSYMSILAERSPSARVFQARRARIEAEEPMKRLAIAAVVVGLAACSGSVGGPAGSTSSGGGGVVGRGAVIDTAPQPLVMTTRTAGVDPGVDSLAFARAQMGALGLSAHDDFQLLAVGTGVDGLNHARLQQT